MVEKSSIPKIATNLKYSSDTNIIHNFKPTATLRDIQIHLEINHNKEIILTLDQILFELAVRNLIDNAIKYSEDENNIFIRSEVNNDQKLIITFENETKNEITENIKDLSKRFNRGKDSQNIVGTGLGLSIVSESMQILNGDFDIKIEKGKKICANLEFLLV